MTPSGRSWIGHADAATIETLSQLARTSRWHATALGVIGDFDGLEVQPAPIAGVGICAPPLAIATDDMNTPPPLSYGRLESLLDRRGDELQELIEQELKPGRRPIRPCVAWRRSCSESGATLPSPIGGGSTTSHLTLDDPTADRAQVAALVPGTAPPGSDCLTLGQGVQREERQLCATCG